MKASVGLHLSSSTLGSSLSSSALDATGLSAIASRIGGFGPAPVALMAGLDSVGVTQSDRAPNGFQLGFTTPRSPAEVNDYMVLASNLLIPGRRVIVTAAVSGGSTQVLIDGIVTRVQVQAAGLQEEARITVTGEDLSVLMDLYEYSLEYPLLTDSLIVEAVLAKWIFLGIVPTVTSSVSDLVNMFNISQQVGTDRAYLNRLAAQRAYVFCLIPGPTVGWSTAYWGPPMRTLPPQPTLTVDNNGFGNVIAFSSTFDGTAAQQVYGFVQDTLTGLPLPTGSVFSMRDGTLASRPVLPGLSFNPQQYVDPTGDQAGAIFGSAVTPPTLLKPMRLFGPDGLNILQAQVMAQGIVDASTDQVATATGRLDVLRYGSILTAPGVVGVRGAGYSFDGYYYVQKVTHSISRGAYIQEFALAREGLGSTVSTLPSS